MHVFQSVVPGNGHSVELTFSTGESALVDFEATIQQGGVFQPLADPTFFAKVAIGQRGRSIEWPGGIDFCADALWQEAFARNLLKT